jgi:hypothetical protein
MKKVPQSMVTEISTAAQKKDATQREKTQLKEKGTRGNCTTATNA